MGKIKRAKEQFKKSTFNYKKKKLFYMFVGLPIPVIFAIFGYFFGLATTTIVAITSLGFVLVMVPYFAFEFLEFREIKMAEDSYPNFLRDLAQNVSSGMTLPQAIATSADTEYGQLSKYVKKLHIWLSWSTPFPKAWQKFTNLLEKSDLIKKINGIILESFYSGGDIKNTLNSLADDVNLLKTMESQKKSIISQQIIIMYVVFFIFVGVVIGLFQILTPIIFIQQLGVFSGINLSGGQEKLTIEYFKTLFFLMTLVQSVCAGIIAGQLSEEKLIAGFKHVLVMVSVSIFLFFVVIFPSHLNFEVSVYPSAVAAGDKITLGGQVFYESAPASGADITIITPDKKSVRAFADNLGEFRRTIIAPDKPGTYDLIFSVKYKNDEQVVIRQIKVKD